MQTIIVKEKHFKELLNMKKKKFCRNPFSTVFLICLIVLLIDKSDQCSGLRRFKYNLKCKSLEVDKLLSSILSIFDNVLSYCLKVTIRKSISIDTNNSSFEIYWKFKTEIFKFRR